jgi:D-3-phosphoglycerate dehydrogenase
MPFRLLIADDILPEGLAVLRAAPDVQADDLRLSRAELLERLGEYDALITRSGTPVDRQLLERGSRLKIVARAGLHFDNIDVAEATERGIMVMNAPHQSALAAAEHTLALLLALCRHLPAADATVRRGAWERTPFMGAQLAGKTLGIIGFGRVGRLVAQRAVAFGLKVLVYDPYQDEEMARQLRVTAATFDEVLTRADFLSLHAALTPDTRHLIGRAELARLKPGARLINCARGELVDEVALYDALASGHLAGAALDVFETEPPTESPLRHLPNVVLSPHLGASTLEAQREVSTQIAQQVLDVLRGVDYVNVLNLPFATGPNFARLKPYLDLAETLGALQSQLAAGSLKSIEIEVKGDGMSDLVKPVAVALLKGLFKRELGDAVNYINAPIIALARGLHIAQTRGLDLADYANLISCRVTWVVPDGAVGHHLLAGTLFAGAEARVVQLDAVRMDARPHGHVLVMFSRDVPGVIGIVGTLLFQYQVNIAEWRLGRDQPGGTALSFINLDSPVPASALTALTALPQVIQVQQVHLA